MFPTSLGLNDNLVHYLGKYNRLRRRAIWLAKLARPEINTRTVTVVVIPDGMDRVRVPKPKALAYDAFMGEAYPLYTDTHIEEYVILKYGGKGRRTGARFLLSFAYVEEMERLFIRGFWYWPGRKWRWEEYHA